MAEPAAKKARTDEVAEGAEEAAEAPEQEQDAKPLKGAKIAAPTCIHTQDTTMNVMQGLFGNVLMPLTDGGLQYLTAAARASTGLRSGRYAFEAKILELMSPADDPAAKQKLPQAKRQQFRIGFAASGSSLFLGETEDSICFRMEGSLLHNKQKTACSQKFGADTVVAVVLNLDTASPNKDTVSLFRNGVRACQPQALPESLRGKALFPAISFKQATVQYNFGPEPLVKLPFTCHMVGSALAKDATVVPAPKDTAREVLFPVCLPDEGTFDWLDSFLEKNPSYTELSDRAILKWCEMSGLPRAKAARTSIDKPEPGFGVSMLDDHSIRRALQGVAPLQQRNYVVMEVKSNLLKEERKELLDRWASSGLRRRARVLMGEPPAVFKQRSLELILQDKQEKANSEFKVKFAVANKKKEEEKLKKKKEKDRQLVLKKQKKTQEALQKKLQLQKKMKEAAAKGETYVPEEEKEEEEDVEEEPDEEEADEPMDEEPPVVELTAEEKKLHFRKGAIPDLTSFTLSTNFAKFSVPESGEGFDEVTFEWAKEAACKDLLRQWIQEKKTTTRVEDLQPGEWFAGRWKEWQKQVQTWHSKQNLHKGALAKRAAEFAAKRQKKAQAKSQKETKAKVAAMKHAAAVKAAEAKGEPAPEEPKEEEEPEPEQPEEDEEEDGREEFDQLDIFGVEDILDATGKGEPLFSQFGFEDWAMMSIRFELHLLVHAFKRDVNDPDRMGICVDHITFYYKKYFKKNLNIKFFGCESIQELLDLLKDTVFVSKKRKVVEAQLVADMESPAVFAMLTEEARRDRNRRMDLGDESAKLKIQTPSTQQAGAGSGAGAGAAAPATVAPRQAGALGMRPTMPSGGQVVRPAGAQGAWAGQQRPVAAGALGPGAKAAAMPGMMSQARPGFGGMRQGGWQGGAAWRG